jgi:photosystem II stability/assembly factor-like uncharacterized protein
MLLKKNNKRDYRIGIENHMKRRPCFIAFFFLVAILSMVLCSDACASWNLVTNPTSNVLKSAFLVSPNDGWAVGDAGTILRWNGATWSKINIMISTSAILNSVFMLNSNEGWICGNALNSSGNIIPSSYMLRWNGIEWNAYESLTNKTLNAVCAISSNSAWAVGEGGVIIRWDGATTYWKKPTSPTTSTLNSLSQTGENDVWAVGNSGTIIHWNGATWSTVSSPTTSRLRTIFMANSTSGWAAGDGGTLLRWDGNTWTSFPLSPSPGDITALSMLSSSEGWLTSNSVIMRWNGTSWNNVASPNGAWMNSIFMRNSTFGMAVGNGGQIMQWSLLAPTANFSASPTAQEINKAVDFDASTSLAPDGIIVSYIWDFGDGTSGLGKTITHSYSSASSYQAKLTVTDTNGLVGTTIKQITISSPPTNSATNTSPLTAPPPTTPPPTPPNTIPPNTPTTTPSTTPLPTTPPSIFISSPSPASSFSPTTSATVSPKQLQINQLANTIWVPQPTNAAIAALVTAVAVGAVSATVAAATNPVAQAAEKAGPLPDSVNKWLTEYMSSKRKQPLNKAKGSPFKPTQAELLAYGVSLIVMTISFAYAKVPDFSQILVVVPTILATSIVIEIGKNFSLAAFARYLGVWTENRLWYLGLVLFVITAFVFGMPFSNPSRTVYYEPEITKRREGIVASVAILITLGFAAIFFVLLTCGFTLIGSMGMGICFILALIDTFPFSPMNGKAVYKHNKAIWATMFVATLAIYITWLMLH